MASSIVTKSLVDIGANLTHKSFGSNIRDFLERAEQSGVTKILVTGTSLESSRKSIEMANIWNEKLNSVKLYSTVGIHPHDASRHVRSNYREQIVRIVDGQRSKTTNPIVAIGECGLDFDRNFSTSDDQKLVFENQVQLSIDLDLPLFLHERSASKEFVEILTKFSNHSRFRGVVHCFTNGSIDVLQQYLAMNLYIGITGWLCDDRRADDLRKIVSRIPLDKILVETDAPFLLPRNVPKPWPKINEPALLPYVVKKLASFYGLTEQKMAEITTENAQRLFQL